MGGDEGELKPNVEAGAKIRVTGDVIVYHVPKQPKTELKGREGEVLDVVTFFKGKQISANLPYKCVFLEDLEDGSQKKITAHLVSLRMLPFPPQQPCMNAHCLGATGFDLRVLVGQLRWANPAPSHNLSPLPWCCLWSSC